MTIAPEDDELTIVTPSQRLGGWHTMRASRSVERLPSDFEITLSDRYPGEIAQGAIQPGTAIQVYLGADLILTGYIDKFIPRLSAREHLVTLRGRSRCEDIVDCQVTDLWQLNVSSLKAGVEIVLKKFTGIQLSMPDGDAEIPPEYYFEIHPGMSVYAIIEELARSVGFLVWDDPQGRLVLSKVGTKRAATAIVEGQNLELGAANLSADLRYSKYIVMSQAPRPDGHANVSAEVDDAGVTRYRPRVILMETTGPATAIALKRANWEKNRRYGRSAVAKVAVTGWRTGDGSLWTPNTVVAAQLPSLKVNRDLVISECEWSRSDAGTQTALTLMPAEGLSPEPFQRLPPLVGTTNPAPPL